MMNREEFKTLINSINDAWDFVEGMMSNYKVDMMDSKPMDTISKLEKALFIGLYGNEGYDWVSWFLCEKMCSKNPEEMRAFDENGNEICKTIDDLYDFLEKNYKK